MHWIRIDRYFKGDADDPNPEVVFQPLTCQHCENAPCEQVCPVGATVHDTEGLNVMVYNRCVGTRYCSNNCPYKVRRFNYLDWHSQDPRHDKYPKPYLNIPDQQQLEHDSAGQADGVQSGSDGSDARRDGEMHVLHPAHPYDATSAKRARGEELEDGDIMTACQQSCPTQAIVFGDLNDPKVEGFQVASRIRGRMGCWMRHCRRRPRNRYLAKSQQSGGGMNSR